MSSNLSDSGCQLLRNVLTASQVSKIASEVGGLLADPASGAIESRSRKIVGGRNLQGRWDGWRAVCEQPQVAALMRDTLGDRFGLVRILYFDKPPGQGWNLSMHRDQAIAVADHLTDPAPYSRPNRKAGVPHVIADASLLEQMLTLRLHLDPMHRENGPLLIAPGSHRDRDDLRTSEPIELQCNAGDVFVMRPLLMHGSRAPSETCRDHRRVVHMEFAPEGAISDRYEWYQYDAIESQ